MFYCLFGNPWELLIKNRKYQKHRVRRFLWWNHLTLLKSLGVLPKRIWETSKGIFSSTPNKTAIMQSFKWLVNSTEQKPCTGSFRYSKGSLAYNCLFSDKTSLLMWTVQLDLYYKLVIFPRHWYNPQITYCCNQTLAVFLDYSWTTITSLKYIALAVNQCY